MNLSPTANPYAADPSEFTLSGIVRVDGEILYCRQDADLRGYCFVSGKPCQVQLDHQFTHPVMPLWIWHWRWNLICIIYLTICSVAALVSLEAASLCCLLRLVLEVPMLFLPKFRARTSITSHSGFNVRLHNQRRSLVALIGLLPLVVLVFIFGGKAFNAIVFLALIACAIVGESLVNMFRVSEVGEDLYAIEGLAPEFVANIRAELSDSHPAPEGLEGAAAAKR